MIFEKGRWVVVAKAGRDADWIIGEEDPEIKEKKYGIARRIKAWLMADDLYGSLIERYGMLSVPVGKIGKLLEIGRLSEVEIEEMVLVEMKLRLRSGKMMEDAKRLVRGATGTSACPAVIGRKLDYMVKSAPEDLLAIVRQERGAMEKLLSDWEPGDGAWHSRILKRAKS